MTGEVSINYSQSELDFYVVLGVNLLMSAIIEIVNIKQGVVIIALATKS